MEADNKETEEDGEYNSEYDQEDENRENRFFDNDEDDGPMYIKINPKFQQQVERPSSRAGKKMENAEGLKNQHNNQT